MLGTFHTERPIIYIYILSSDKATQKFYVVLNLIEHIFQREINIYIWSFYKKVAFVRFLKARHCQ